MKIRPRLVTAGSFRYREFSRDCAPGNRPGREWLVESFFCDQGARRGRVARARPRGAGRERERYPQLCPGQRRQALAGAARCRSQHLRVKRERAARSGPLLLDPSVGLAEPEESEQGQHEDDNQDDPENRHPRLLSSSGLQRSNTRRSCARTGNGLNKPMRADVCAKSYLLAALPPPQLPPPGRTCPRRDTGQLPRPPARARDPCARGRR